jgi:hypothetical protein
MTTCRVEVASAEVADISAPHSGSGWNLLG